MNETQGLPITAICTDAMGADLTVGKRYEVTDGEGDLIMVVDDKGEKRNFFPNRFQ
jgi:hypothetical protein